MDGRSCHDRARDVFDVLLSFSPADMRRVLPICEGLRKRNLAVHLNVDSGRHGLADRIRDTECVVVVCWSHASVRDMDVLADARIAKEASNLFQVLLDQPKGWKLPKGIGLAGAASLVNWKGDYDDGWWRNFYDALMSLVVKQLGIKRILKQVYGSGASFKRINIPQAEADQETSPKDVDHAKKQGNKVFICYRRDDSAGHAGRVWDRLEKEFGSDLLFMDVDAIPLGKNFVKVIREAVSKCDVLLAVIGPKWLTLRDKQRQRRIDDENDYVRIEISTALHRDIAVIPLLLDGAKMPKANQLPSDLHELTFRSALEVRHSSFQSDMDRLVRELKSGSG